MFYTLGVFIFILNHFSLKFKRYDKTPTLNESNQCDITGNESRSVSVVVVSQVSNLLRSVYFISDTVCPFDIRITKIVRY